MTSPEREYAYSASVCSSVVCKYLGATDIFYSQTVEDLGHMRDYIMSKPIFDSTWTRGCLVSNLMTGVHLETSRLTHEDISETQQSQPPSIPLYNVSEVELELSHWVSSVSIFMGIRAHNLPRLQTCPGASRSPQGVCHPFLPITSYEQSHLESCFAI
jgi:hypothetical protein